MAEYTLHQSGVNAMTSLLEVDRMMTAPSVTAETRDKIFAAAAAVIDGVFNSKPIIPGVYTYPAAFAPAVKRAYAQEEDGKLLADVLSLLGAKRQLTESEKSTVRNLTSPLKEAIKLATFGHS